MSPHRSFRSVFKRVLVASLFAALIGLPQLALAANNEFETALARGPLYAAFVALLGGLLVSLTPCVYPMIAITVSVFGARQSKSPWTGLGLSSAFVLGIICMFTPLGVVAGMTGSLFGAALQNPWVLCAIAVLFVAMAASMLGAYELALPSAITNRLATVGGVGPKGAFGLGLVCGLIAAPCTGPVLTGILTYIAKTQSASTGALAMLAFSLGLGVPFLVVGTFAVRLPKSGAWMLHVKSLLAIVLSVVALYYFVTAFPQLGAWIEPSNTVWILASLAVVTGLGLGAVHREFSSPDFKDRFLKGLGTFITTLGAFVLVAAFTKPERELNWNYQSFEQGIQAAHSLNKPLLIDFTAAWCGACKELDKHTFADHDVSREASRFYAVKVDATNDEDPKVVESMKALGVVGLPTVVLFDSAGKEAHRFTDFVGAESFLKTLKSVE